MVRVFPSGSISNRRSRSSRNGSAPYPLVAAEHIESEIALKPELMDGYLQEKVRAYRIGDRAQAGTHFSQVRARAESISNRRSRSSRNATVSADSSSSEHIESEIALKPERVCGHAV